MDKLLQRRIVESVLTEPENDEKNADEEIVMELTEKKSKKGKKCEKETWVMVQHFEMTDEIARQLGHMLTLNAFKRTTTCCTIMWLCEEVNSDVWLERQLFVRHWKALLCCVINWTML